MVHRGNNTVLVNNRHMDINAASSQRQKKSSLSMLTWLRLHYIVTDQFKVRTFFPILYPHITLLHVTLVCGLYNNISNIFYMFYFENDCKWTHDEQLRNIFWHACYIPGCLLLFDAIWFGLTFKSTLLYITDDMWHPGVEKFSHSFQ